MGIFVGTMRQAQVFEAGYGFAFPVWKMNPHDLRVVASPGVRTGTSHHLAPFSSVLANGRENQVA